ncbi:uncharacterized protein FOMMEDRAFT_117778 [Fomitiporia mediterranea MF3/22]|uniref:uncharacterized protein n=1 Tax=Fomitiporia mediterranea (strain MF3/22) TaxID=694068 RepID=UPI0004408925|nr:uncharacterized protein FOMMEDRAFT_117778 [Fomitiporia mediterranea MF3/22]EJD06809.1 hypothetical protein FOMMEDRAFT_117778 [Fomitiporia mediterranea MF3/22]
MSNAASTFRRRLGRAPSPPTWLWYEQIPYDEDSSCSEDDASVDGGDYDDEHDNSCSEDDEDYSHAHRARSERGGAPAAPASESGSSNGDSASGSDEAGRGAHMAQQDRLRASDGSCPKDSMKDVKGKQRAVEPEVSESPKRRERRKKREPVFALRPILTIQKSQGFVWNQDLFVPPYIKDRYVASTSPANSNGCISHCASSYNSMQDYEVDVVEIRVEEGEYADIIS